MSNIQDNFVFSDQFIKQKTLKESMQLYGLEVLYHVML